MEKLYTVSASPHIHSGISTPQIMRDVILALLPALCVSVWFLGFGALYVTAISVASCMFFEYFITRYLLRKPLSLRDGSAAVTGLLLAFNVPTNLPEWMIISGALVSIGIAKMSFGGLGGNPFNPALVGRVFLLISFPVQMTSWPIPQGISTPLIDAVTGPTPLALVKENIKNGLPIQDIMADLPSFSDLLLGNRGGSMGEIAALALLAGFAYLIIRKVITWHIPVCILGTLAVFTGILWMNHPDLYPAPIFHLLSGGAILGAVFMATDYTTSPMSLKGKIAYGIGIGLITALIRVYGAYPEGMSFAILIMNAFVPLINVYMKPGRFGKEVKHG